MPRWLPGDAPAAFLGPARGILVARSPTAGMPARRFPPTRWSLRSFVANLSRKYPRRPRNIPPAHEPAARPAFGGKPLGDLVFGHLHSDTRVTGFDPFVQSSAMFSSRVYAASEDKDAPRRA
jgi:hypothetical protein